MSAYGPTANQIKAQLKALLTPVIGTSGTYKTQIFDYEPLAFKPEVAEDITVLRSPLDTATTQDGEEIKRVNCVIITEDGFSQSPPQSDSTRMETRARGKVVVSRPLLIVSMYQFGKVALNDPNTTESEKAHSAINDAMRRTINENPKLGFTMLGAGGIAGPGQFIEEHSGLQGNPPYVGSFAGTDCHVSVMSLTVKVIEALG